MAVSPLNVQPRVVVEQVVGDGYVALQTGGQTAWVTAGHNTQDESCWMLIHTITDRLNPHPYRQPLCAFTYFAHLCLFACMWQCLFNVLLCLFANVCYLLEQQ